MIEWMWYAVGIGALLSLAAAAGERVVSARGWRTRGLWVGAIASSVVVPLVLPWAGAGSAEAGTEGGAEAGAVLGGIQVLGGSTGTAAGAGVELVLGIAWIASSGVLLLLLLWSVSVLRLRRRRWKRQRLAGTEVLVSARTGPALVGFVRPTIVIPAWMLDWDSRSVGLVVAHEEEHRIARDPLILLIAMMSVIAMPWNLPLWWQAQRLRLATEMDCDARVLGRHPDARAYGLLLLEVGRRASGGGWMATAALSKPRSFLERRVEKLTGGGGIGRRAATLLVATALGGVALVGLLPMPELPAVPAIAGARVASASPAGAQQSEVRAASAAERDTLSLPPPHTPYDEPPKLRDRQTVAEMLERGYPPLLRDSGISGMVTAWVYVDETGTVRSTRIARSSGYEEMDTAAAEALRRFSFTPARNEGVPVPVWIQLPVTFSAAPPAGREAPAAQPTAPPARPAAPGHVEATDRPAATPYDVRPELQNRMEFARLLSEAYPPMLKDAGVQGTATYWVRIDAEGRVVEVRVAGTSGHEALDRAGQNVLTQARFAPAMHRGAAVPVWIQLPVTFQVRTDG